MAGAMTTYYRRRYKVEAKQCFNLAEVRKFAPDAEVELIEDDCGAFVRDRSSEWLWPYWEPSWFVIHDNGKLLTASPEEFEAHYEA